MKQLNIFAVFLLLICMSGCGAASEAYADKQQETTVEQTETETTTETTVTETTTEATTMDPDAAADAFYKDAVFVGDSIMDGFRIYSSSTNVSPYLKNIRFYSSVNFSIRHALSPVNAPNSVHPMYKGQKTGICEALKDMNPSRIFIDLGINDVAGASYYSSQRYSQLLYSIKQACPNSIIYVVSVTQMLDSSQRPGVYTNADITAFNGYLKEYAPAWGVRYVDLNASLVNESGSIPPEIIADGYVHFNTDGYRRWDEFFKNYAAQCIAEGEPIITTAETTTEATTAAATQVVQTTTQAAPKPTQQTTQAAPKPTQQTTQAAPKPTQQTTQAAPKPTQQTTQAAPKPTVEPTTQPTTQAVSQPAAEPTTQPAAQAASQPAVQTTAQADPQPITQAASQPETQAQQVTEQAEGSIAASPAAKAAITQ